MEINIKLEDVLDDYGMDDIYDILAEYIRATDFRYNIIGSFVKDLVAYIRDEDFEAYKELMKELKELGKETNKIGEYEGP